MERRLLYLAIFLAAVGTASAGSLHKLWELNLKESIKEIQPSAVRAPTVFALRFSPDGQRIAIVVEQYVPKGSESAMSHLLIVPVQGSYSSVRQFEVNVGATDLDNLHSWPSLEWTAAGDAVLAYGELVRIADRKACALTPVEGAPGSLLQIAENAWTDAGRVARVLLLDSTCKPEGRWNFARDWVVEDVSIDRGLICVRQPIQWAPKEIVAAEAARIAGMSDDVLVVDPIAGKTLKRWSPDVVHIGDLRFGDNGRVICGGRRSEAAGRTPMRCWDTNTGEQVGEAPTVSGGDPISVAAHATRAVASDYRHVNLPFAGGYKQVLKRRVIWDFKTSKELASWHPELQSYDIGLEPVKKEWFAFTMSPDGQFIAEGGNGVLRLYKIDP